MTEGLDHLEDMRDRYLRILDRIGAACDRAGRDPSEVTLVAVSKTFPVSRIRALNALGHRDFGENKVQEFVSKSAVLPGSVGGGPITWHMIGHLQRNKARDVARHADLFHALDSVRLASALDRRCAEVGRVLPCLVQVNVSGEESKFGVSADALPDLLEAVAPLEHIRVRGLMTLAAAADNPEDVRPQLRRLRRLAETWSDPGSDRILDALSMGMSGDFEVAVEEGATHVRVGSAIFGTRSPNP